ncbi:hypothetical protein ACXZ66_06855 [Corynebacterium sp. S7]
MKRIMEKNPYIPTREVVGNHIKRMIDYDYRKTKPWPDNCPVYKALGIEPGQSHRLEWVDHPVVEKEDGHTVYVSHPYQIHGGDLKDFIALEEKGFQVTISGGSEYSLSTARVTIHTPQKEN